MIPFECHLLVPTCHHASMSPRGSAAQVGTALRAVRSPSELRISIGPTAGSESPPYPKQHRSILSGFRSPFELCHLPGPPCHRAHVHPRGTAALVRARLRRIRGRTELGLVGVSARLIARVSAKGGHSNDRPTHDPGRVEHPCSAAAGKGWPALPDASGRHAVAPLPSRLRRADHFASAVSVVSPPAAVASSPRRAPT